MGQSSEDRNNLRAVAFASDGDDRKIVEFRGKQYEIRAPSLAQQALAEKRATKDGQIDKATEGVLLLIGSVYVPGTDEMVFETADKDALLKMPQTKRGLQYVLTSAIRELVTGGVADGDAVEKNSESAPT